MLEATNDDLQLSTENMQRNNDGPATLKRLLCRLQEELDKGSITIYPQAMEPKVCFRKTSPNSMGTP